MSDEEKKEEKKEAGETQEENKETSEEKTEEVSKEETKEKKEEQVEEKAQESKPEQTTEETPKIEEKPKESKPVLSAEAQAKPEPTGKFKELIKQIENLTALELAELVKALEERFGVSAAAPVAAAPQSGAGTGKGAETEEKTHFTVTLADSGSQKIAVIKALREINQELGLKEAKDIADTPPKEILKEVAKEKAEEAKKKLEAAGAKVELK